MSSNARAGSSPALGTERETFESLFPVFFIIVCIIVVIIFQTNQDEKTTTYIALLTYYRFWTNSKHKR